MYVDGTKNVYLESLGLLEQLLLPENRKYLLQIILKIVLNIWDTIMKTLK